jgi:hypothetical protein
MAGVPLWRPQTDHGTQDPRSSDSLAWYSEAA